MLNFSDSSVLRDRHAQRGFSLVELLVATAVGLVLTTWAISMFVTSLGNNRKLITEAQVNQNLRAAADLITREVRRAGYWGDRSPSSPAIAWSAATRRIQRNPV